MNSLDFHIRELDKLNSESSKALDYILDNMHNMSLETYDRLMEAYNESHARRPSIYQNIQQDLADHHHATMRKLQENNAVFR
jgi:iron-sulfur cluster repair protein YtfE (RIC family)